MSKLTAQRTGSSALPEPSPISAVTNGSEAPPYLVPEERQDTAEPAQPAHDFEFREIRLHTEPVIHQRSFMHFIGSALGVQTDHVTGVHATNEIRTSKYTILTFLPKNLFYQFMRVANLYFLLMAGLQLIPGLSPTSWFTTVFPLCCVLAVNAIKEAYDDIGRHRSDKDINTRHVLLLSRGGREDEIEWRDIRCGMVIKIRQDEEVPADCVILSTSDEGHICHVETANLDGETNLKLKNAFQGTQTAHTADQLSDFEHRLAVHSELPNPKLYHFDGSVVDISDPTRNQLPLTIDNLLLRGCSLRKTNWVIGLVVFTGNDSKIMMNRTPAPRKITQVERHMNILVLIMFGILLLFACTMSIGFSVTQVKQDDWYLEWTGQWPDPYGGFTSWIVSVLRWIILLNGIIPISLYVTIEMVKVLQCAAILNTDRQMYYRETDTPFRCRTTNLNEDLGQVQYVLSDKTGTLTQNVMGFVWASVDKHLYGKTVIATQNTQPGAPKSGKSKLRPGHVPDNTPHTLLLDPALHQKLGQPFAALAGGSGAVSLSPPDDAVATFFTCLALCNTVVPQILEDGRFVYQASSPDEEALVEGAAMAGFRLVQRSTTQVEMEYNSQRLTYKVLCVLEFNSDRKRMSIILKCPDGKIRLYCKGADTMIMARIRGNQLSAPAVRRHLAEMAQAGYRTLVIAQKELTNEQWNTWWQTYHAASVALENREQKVHQAAEKIESDMELLGATAVEDKLQDGVPEAIASMVAAGIKVWVLTGDKVETAISIAFSCRLFSDDMAIVELRDRDFERALAQAGCQRSARSGHFNVAAVGTMDDILKAEDGVFQQKIDEVEAENIRIVFEADQANMARQAAGDGVNGDMNASTRSHRGALGAMKHETHVGLVIEGGALAVGLQKEHQDRLIQLCSSCRSVVCCRVSPMQKAAVTKLVQLKCNAITLGIGDGANDVGMIQAAHIGCGISGREGRAAVMASDYSFAQFKYVARLLLVHGRAAYKRNSEVVLYSFYKNWLYQLTYIYFGFYTVWSSQPLYTTGMISTFNVLWAAVPIIVYAFTEQDVSAQTLMEFPLLYQDSMTATRKTFLVSLVQWLLLGTWHSLVVYFVPLYSLGSSPTKDGLATDWVMFGNTVYIAMVIVVNLKVAMRTRYWTWLNHLFIWASILLWFPFLYLYGLVWPVAQIDGTADMSEQASDLFPNPNFWLAGILLAPCLSMLLDITILTFRRHLAPFAYEILQEWEYMETVRKQVLSTFGVGVQTAHVSSDRTATQATIDAMPVLPEGPEVPSRSVVVTDTSALEGVELMPPPILPTGPNKV